MEQSTEIQKKGEEAREELNAVNKEFDSKKEMNKTLQHRVNFELFEKQRLLVRLNRTGNDKIFTMGFIIC